MKKRNGFVSNSSSSSFIILGDYIEGYDLFEEYQNLKDKEYIVCCGHYGSEGEDIFEVTEEIMQIIAAENKAEDFNYCLVKGVVDAEVKCTMSDFKINGEFYVIPLEKDYYSLTTTEEFERRYLRSND